MATACTVYYNGSNIGTFWFDNPSDLKLLKDKARYWHDMRTSLSVRYDLHYWAKPKWVK